jgi:hypothetical protein
VQKPIQKLSQIRSFFKALPSPIKGKLHRAFCPEPASKIEPYLPIF